MAGIKDTPRQKMVNLMYLVLTALLALQVDNTVLEKLLFIDDSLQYGVNEARKDNGKILDGIKDAVEKRGKNPKDLIIWQKANQIVAETDAVMKEIEDFRKQIVEVSGGKNEDGTYKGAASYDEVMHLALGAGNSRTGKAYKLKAMLNNYSKKISEYDTALKIKPLALDASQIEQFKNKDEQKNKDFAELNFENTPTAAALAVLSQMQTEVAKVETKALDRMASLVGVKQVFDKIIPVISAESQVVTAGTPYKAKMFVTVTSSANAPKMSASVGNVKMSENGEGSIEFIAQASDFDATGKAKRVWKGTFVIPTPNGDSTFEVQQEYFIAKPNIQIQAANVQALYLNCGNKLNIQVPELGTYYEPSFTATGADVQTTPQKGIITVIPNNAQVDLVVKNKGFLIGNQKFKVKRIPLPSIQYFNGNSNIKLNLIQGGSAPRSISVKAIPDADFKEFLPEDARYKVTNVEVTLARGRNMVKMQRYTDGSNIDLNAFAAEARAGDRLIIQVLEVKRMNFRNQVETVNGIGLQVATYTITN
jgi:gliding motility-associated protein GldM